MQIRYGSFVLLSFPGSSPLLQIEHSRAANDPKHCNKFSPNLGIFTFCHGSLLQLEIFNSNKAILQKEKLAYWRKVHLKQCGKRGWRQPNVYYFQPTFRASCRLSSDFFNRSTFWAAPLPPLLMICRVNQYITFQQLYKSNCKYWH